MDKNDLQNITQKTKDQGIRIKTTQRNNGLKYRIFRRILTCLVEL
jgi:hypothetical protein